MSSEFKTLIWRILLVTTLYLLQGCIQGFVGSIPLYLVSYKASWRQQGTYNWVFYPYSFKILWAPIIDSIYIHRFGRRHTWLIPVQITIGIILIILSFYLESLLINLRISLLTIIFFLIYFLIATQDIVVDGWSVSLFNTSNPQWASTCQIIGQMIGTFIGSTILMTFESSNFTNKYIREPLSLPHRSYGLFTLQQFTLFWGIIFIIVSIILMIIPLFKKNKKPKEINLNVLETYLAVVKLFKKRCIREFILILLTYCLGFAATARMTNLTLMEYGVTRDNIALMNIPLFVIHIIIPICLSRTRRPLIWFARGYILRLITSFILAIYIYFTSKILHTSYFYPVLTVLLCLNEICVYLMVVSLIGFFAKISELHIASTYMTLLVTIYNLGGSLTTTSVLYIANWLPKAHAYSIEVAACTVLGIIWIALTWRRMKRLSALPVEEWYLNPSVIASSQSTITECT